MLHFLYRGGDLAGDHVLYFVQTEGGMAVGKDNGLDGGIKRFEDDLRTDNFDMFQVGGVFFVCLENHLVAMNDEVGAVSLGHQEVP